MSTVAGWTRRVVSPGEVRRRIAMGRMFLAIRGSLSNKEWADLVKAVGCKMEDAQEWMRIAKKFQHIPYLLDRMVDLDLPFGIIKNLSSGKIPEEIISRFLGSIHKKPSEAECKELLSETAASYELIMQSPLPDWEDIEDQCKATIDAALPHIEELENNQAIPGPLLEKLFDVLCLIEKQQRAS